MRSVNERQNRRERLIGREENTRRNFLNFYGIAGDIGIESPVGGKCGWRIGGYCG